MTVMVKLIVVGALGKQRARKKSGGIVDQRKNWDRPEYSPFKIN